MKRLPSLKASAAAVSHIGKFSNQLREDLGLLYGLKPLISKNEKNRTDTGTSYFFTGIILQQLPSRKSINQHLFNAR